MDSFLRIAELFPNRDDAFPGNAEWLPRFQVLGKYISLRNAAEAMGSESHLVRQAIDAMIGSGMPPDMCLLWDVISSLQTNAITVAVR